MRYTYNYSTVDGGRKSPTAALRDYPIPPRRIG